MQLPPPPRPRPAPRFIAPHTHMPWTAPPPAQVHMVDGEKRKVEKLLNRRKLKKDYEYEVQWQVRRRAARRREVWGQGGGVVFFGGGVSAVLLWPQTGTGGGVRGGAAAADDAQPWRVAADCSCNRTCHL